MADPTKTLDLTTYDRWRVSAQEREAAEAAVILSSGQSPLEKHPDESCQLCFGNTYVWEQHVSSLCSPHHISSSLMSLWCLLPPLVSPLFPSLLPLVSRVLHWPLLSCYPPSLRLSFTLSSLSVPLRFSFLLLLLISPSSHSSVVSFLLSFFPCAHLSFHLSLNLFLNHLCIILFPSSPILSPCLLYFSPLSHLSSCPCLCDSCRHLHPTQRINHLLPPRVTAPSSCWPNSVRGRRRSYHGMTHLGKPRNNLVAI